MSKFDRIQKRINYRIQNFTLPTQSSVKDTLKQNEVANEANSTQFLEVKQQYSPFRHTYTNQYYVEKYFSPKLNIERITDHMQSPL